LEAQGHTITSNIFEQDNASAICLEKNGRSSAGKQSRHINIRYFLKDWVKMENINVRHCPTEEMLADFLTKPLQGNLFRKFRDVLLGYHHVSSLQQNVTDASSPEERVEREIENEELVGSREYEITGQVNDTYEICTREERNNWTLVTSRKHKSGSREQRGSQ
jgi:hypothetical protein